MSETTNGEQDPNIRISQLEAENAALLAQNAELATQRDALIAQVEEQLAVTSNLQNAITAANEASAKTNALATDILAKIQGKSAPKDMPTTEVKSPVKPTPAPAKPKADNAVDLSAGKPALKTPSRPANPGAGKPEAKKPEAAKKHKARNRVIGVLAVAGAIAATWFVGTHSKGDTQKVVQENTPTRTATTPASSNPNAAGAENNSLANLLGGAANTPANANTGGATVAQVAKATKPNAAPAKSAHERALDRADAAKTVAGAVDQANPTSSTVKHDIHAFANAPGKDTLDHSHGAMSSELSHFKAGEMTSSEAALAVFNSAKGSPAYAAKVYNELHGNHKATALPQGVSNEQALKSIESKLTADGTKFNIRNDLHGLGLNHGQRGENVFNANIMSLDGKEFLVIRLNDGTEMIVKVENNCLNIIDRIVVKQKQATPATPATPKTPGSVFTPGKPSTPGHIPGKVQQPKPKPTTPQTPLTPVTPLTPPEEHPGPKHDGNTNPAGVQGEPGGSGGTGLEQSRPQAGDAPAGVGQPQEATPTPVTPAGNEATPTAPAETGVDPGVTGPADQTNPGANTPAQQMPATSTLPPIG